MTLKLALDPAADPPEVSAVSALDGDPEARGFRAQLDGLSLWDLVQMECLAGTRKALEVRSDGRAGRLFFERGQLVHAAYDNRVGDAAALELLSWRTGELTPCDAAWPRARTVVTPWQSLLLQAAQQRDERESHVMRRINSGVLVIDSLPELDAAVEPSSPEPASARRFAGVPSRLAARIDPSGEIIEQTGSDPEFGGRTTYAVRLADLLGETLALGPLCAMEVRTSQGVVFCMRDADGALSAVAPEDAAACAAVRKDLSL